MKPLASSAQPAEEVKARSTEVLIELDPATFGADGNGFFVGAQLAIHRLSATNPLLSDREVSFTNLATHTRFSR